MSGKRLATRPRWGHSIEAITPQWRAAYLAYLGDQWIKDPADAPSEREFFEVFEGKFESFEDYADVVVTDSGMLIGVPDEVSRYFSIENYARDLAMDYTTIDTGASDYAVWVYRNSGYTETSEVFHTHFRVNIPHPRAM